MTCAAYAKKHGLHDTAGWKHLKCYGKTDKRLIQAAKQSRLRQAGASIRYKFGYQVPRNYQEAAKLDQENGHSKH